MMYIYEYKQTNTIIQQIIAHTLHLCHHETILSKFIAQPSFFADALKRCFVMS